MAVNGIVERGGCTKLREGGGGAGQEIGFTFSFTRWSPSAAARWAAAWVPAEGEAREPAQAPEPALLPVGGAGCCLRRPNRPRKPRFSLRGAFSCAGAACAARAGSLKAALGAAAVGGFWRRRSKLLRYRFSRNIKLDGRPCYPLVCTGLFGFRRLGSALRRYRLRCGLSSLGCLRLAAPPEPDVLLQPGAQQQKLSLFGGTTLGRAAGFLCMAGGLQAHGVRFCAAGGPQCRRRFRKHRRWLRLCLEPLVRLS